MGSMKVLIWLLILFVCWGCHRLQVTEAIESRPWPETAKLAALTDAVNTADGYVVGTVEKAVEDWTYDRPRGGPHTYLLTIRATDGGKWYLRVFVPEGNYLPLSVGTYAVFIWRYAYVYPLLKCRAHAAATLVCSPDWLPVMGSRNDVAAPSDSALVAKLFANK